MQRKTILISGAGIAGPTLAYWLLRRGFQPVIVERAPTLRTGGYMVDFWGVGYDVAERMDLIPALQRFSYAYDRVAFAGRRGTVRSVFGGSVLRRSLGGRFLSIQRGTLARSIYDTVRNRIETIFGNEIVRLETKANYVEVHFKSGDVRAFDLVVGADGLHSMVRNAMLGQGKAAERFLGYYAAAFTADGYSKRIENTYWSYAAPGRQISRFALRGGRTGFLLVFSKKDYDPAFARGVDEQKQALSDIFSQDPWIEWPEIKAHLVLCSDLYFDAVTQIELPAWSSGRLALVGDAAYCPSLLAGEGSAFAMAGAYILAGELERASGHHACAFPAYEQHFRSFMERKQKSARTLASSFAPRTYVGLATRDLVFHLAHFPFIAAFLTGKFVTDRYSLPNY